MKKPLMLLIALAMSGPAFALTPGPQAPVSVITVHCDPGSCFSGSAAAQDLTQGLVGYARQVQRVMRPVETVGTVGDISFSSQPE